MTEHNTVLMFSGGLDSYLAFLLLKDKGIKFKAVYAEHGSKNNDQQLERAKQIMKEHPDVEFIIDRTLNLGQWEQEDAYIPNRNGLLAYAGALYGDYIYFAIMDGEQSYPDCQESTFLALSLSLSKLGDKPVAVDSPFWDKTKAEVIEDLDPEFYDNLLQTYSCHKDGEIHCGDCTACFRRACAFTLNGIRDTYMVNPFKTKLAEEYVEKATMGHYGHKRDTEILEAVAKGTMM